MAFIRQRNKSDCGVACLAMLCDVTYDEAKETIPWRRRGVIGGTVTKQLRIGALKLGYLTSSTPQHRLKVVRKPDTWEGMPVPMTSDWWYTIPNNSLVKIQWGDSPGGDWHWVVWKKEKIYDPARGVFHPSKYGYKPMSYMEFIKI